MNPFASKLGPVTPGMFSGVGITPQSPQRLQMPPLQNIMGGRLGDRVEDRGRFGGLQNALMAQKSRNQFGGPGSAMGGVL